MSCVNKSRGYLGRAPKTSSAGESCVEALGVLLMANSTWEMTLHQSLSCKPCSDRRQRMHCSIVLCVRSVCPSVCGWYALVNTVLVPNNFHKDCQNWDVNLGSLSCSTSTGTPKSEPTCYQYNVATCYALSSPSPSLMGIKRTNLVSLSTTVNMPLKVLHEGRSVMKSMLNE